MLKVPEKNRKEHPTLGEGEGCNGYFTIPIGKRLVAHCVVSDGEGWEHVSAHLRDRVTGKHSTPSWDHMCAIKSVFWDKQDCVVQYHSPESEYVNNHKHVLHLWREANKDFVMPPSILVGII